CARRAAGIGGFDVW
nr:immunoglobulin heavy chain junction region [Macaca mulatta]